MEEDNTLTYDGMTFNRSDLRDALDQFDGTGDASVGDVTLSNDGLIDDYIYVSNGDTINQMYVSELRDAVAPEHEGPFIKATNVNDEYGFVVPIDADILVNRPISSNDGCSVHFNTDDDISGLRNVGGPNAMDFDASAFVTSIEIIDGEEV